MAGGTWLTQNKTRPGVYINFESVDGSLVRVGERGTVALAYESDWGPSATLTTIMAGESPTQITGYDITDPKSLVIREAMKRAQKILFYRLNTGVKATVTSGNLVATARYTGIRGNDITIKVQANVDVPSQFDVITLLGTAEVDRQTVSDITGLVNRTWVDFSALNQTNTLAATAGATLTGGTNGTVSNENHVSFLAALETQEFNTFALLYDSATLKPLYTSFAKRMRDNEGKYIVAVMPDYPTADHEGVISVFNGVVLSDGTILDKTKAVAWVAGASAGAAVNQSLTYTNYDDSIDVDTRLTNAQVESALLSGQFVFSFMNDRAIVEQDINTFRSYTLTKGRERSKNRVIRVLDGLGTDTKVLFSLYFIGKSNNDATGRSLVRQQETILLDTYQTINAIQNFDPQNDVTVLAGTEKDAVYIELNVQPTDAMEKIYLRVRVR